MSTKMYNRLRYVTQIFLPALATFLITVGGAWGLEIGVSVGTTISAIVTLLSGVLGASSAIYDKEGGKCDGEGMGDIYSDYSDNLYNFVHVSNRTDREEVQQEEQ